MESSRESIDSLIIPSITGPVGSTPRANGTARNAAHRMRYLRQSCSVYGQCTAAETAERRLAFLAEVSRLLAASLDDRVRMQRLADLVVASMADWCAIHVIEADGAVRQLAVAHAASISGDWTEDLRRRIMLDPSGAQHPVVKVLQTGKPELISEISDTLLIAAANDEQQLDFLRTVNPRSGIIAPLVARGRTFGAITVLSIDSGRHYGPDDLVLTEEVARRAALAIDNIRLSGDVEQQAARLHALAEASQAFAEECLDFHAILPTITRHIVKALGDLCLIRLLSDDGQWLKPAAIYHPIPQVRGYLRDVLTFLPRRADEGLVGRVVRTGQPVLLPEVKPEELDVPTASEIDAYREHLTVHSILIVPLRARGRVIGTIGGWRDRPGYPHTADDQAFVLDLADRAGLAIENARLYQQLAERECRLREMMEPRRAPQPALPDAPLTSRELEVLPYLLQGRTNREIAKSLNVSLSTVKAHIEHIIAKLGVSDRTQAAVRAIELGLVSPCGPA